MAWCPKPGKLVNGGCYMLSLSSGIFSRCHPQMTDDFCVPEAHRGHSGKRTVCAKGERKEAGWHAEKAAGCSRWLWLSDLDQGVSGE